MKKKSTTHLYSLTVDQADQLSDVNGALTRVLDLIGESDDGLHRLLSPHIDSLNAICEALDQRT